jgi:serine/threonine protein phosphatase PrpC
MLEEFKDIYDIHDWLRYVSWLGLLAAAIFLLWAPGGFPPQAWLLFFQLWIQFPGLWSVQGPSLLVPLLCLLLLSLFWLGTWILLIWACMSVIRHHRKQIVDKIRLFERMWGINPRPYRTRAQFAGDSMVEADWLITVPKLSLPQRQPEMQPVTLSSLATVAVGSMPDSPIQPPISTTYTAGPTLFMAASAEFRPLEVGIGWNAGIKRQRAPNEDSVMVLQNICTHHGQLIPFSLLVVADGVGGYECGVEASRMAMHNMMHTVLQNIMLSDELSDEFFSDMLVGGVDWANRTIYQRGREWGKEMATTLTAALVVGTKAYIVNVGDSRTYLYREDVGLRQITRDHSVVATLVAFGKITPDEVYTHPERNKVYRCVGCDENVDVDAFALDLCQGDRLLLCSDGLWEMVRDPVIVRILYHYQDSLHASNALVEAALHGGGVDNVSVIVARVP